MSRTSTNKKVNKAITSAKKHFVKASALALALTALTGCGKKDIDSAVSAINDTTEKIKAVNESVAEKIDKVDKITIPNLFSVKEFFAGDNTDLYDEEGKKVGTLDINALLKIIGSSDDGNWLKTEDGFFVKKDTVNEAPITHVIKTEQQTVYAQFNNVRVHSSADKASAVIVSLPVNQAVVKTGEVEFANGLDITKIDASGDHGWSEIMFKKDGQAVTGYVYTDYIGMAQTETKAEAFEAPSYTDEEKAEIRAKAEGYNLKCDASTDEEYYEVARQNEVFDSYDKEVVKQKEWSSYFGFSEEDIKKMAEADAKELQKQKQNEAEEAGKYVVTIDGQRILRSEATSCVAGWMPKGYDHARTRQAELENAQRQAEIQAFKDSHGGEPSTYSYVDEEGYHVTVVTYPDGYTERYAIK